MREQQNPTTPDLHQPLLFAPSELLACGLRDAHHHPLVGERTEDGVRSWRTATATAWEHPPAQAVSVGARLAEALAALHKPEFNCVCRSTEAAEAPGWTLGGWNEGAL